MNKLISLVLSISLIFGSITPSFAQSNKIIPGAAKTLGKSGAEVAGKSAAGQLSVKGWKYIPGAKAPVATTKAPYNPAIGKLAVTGQPLSTSTHRAAQVSTGSSAAASKKALDQHIEARVADQISRQAPALQLDQLAALAAKKELTQQDVATLYHQIFDVSRSDSAKDFLLLSTLPSLTVERGVAISEDHLAQALQTYRRILLSHNSNVAVNPAVQLSQSQLKEWSKTMAAVSNLGFYGSAKDAALLIDTYNKVPAALKPVSEVIVGRALLNLQAYGALEQLAKLASANGKLSSEFWTGLQSYVKTKGLAVSLPEVQTGANLPNAFQMKRLLGGWSKLNVRHTDTSANATAAWASLNEKKGKVIPAAKEQAAAEQAPQAAPEAFRPEVTINLDDNLKAAEQLSVEAPNVAAGTEEAAAQTAVQEETVAAGVSTTEEAAAASAPKKAFGWIRNLFKSKETKEKGVTDQDAKLILSKVAPLNSQLRRIVEGPTSKSYKQQSLVILYERGVFAKTLATLPIETQTVLKGYNPTELKEALYTLYQHKVFDRDIAALTDVNEQVLLTDEVRRMTGQENWEEMARAAYAAAPSLPLEGENFAGVVPAVPEADQKNISEAFRLDPEFAAKHASQGVEKGDKIYYENHIPFYYRDSQGHLSSQPVGILTQEKASLYGRILSKLHLASKPGFSVPKGFVLALDEQGQWKWVMPVGNLAIVEATPSSKKLLDTIRKQGSVRVEVDIPYSTTDMLALGKMLANNPKLNLELTLNTPHSLKQYLTLHGFFVGNDAGASLAGPYKDGLKSVQGLSGLLGNLTSGIGYLTPWVGGAAMKKMTKWGNAKSTQLIYGLAGGGLLYSLLELGMNGMVDPATLNLFELAIPTVALVLGASLANSFIQTFLNFYKDPTARTSAHLRFSENKQWSRLALTVGSGLAAMMLGLNWTVVVPVGLGLVGMSELLFLNTPVYRDAKRFSRAMRLKKKNQLPESERKFLEKAAAAAPTKFTPEEEAKFTKTYNEMVNSLQEVKDIKTRVKLVYASYAASLLVLNQAATAILGKDVGQILVGLFMFATAMTRRYASKAVSRNKMTDDQLTGISLPLLAISGALLAVVPYVGPVGVVAAALGIIHYMATAVPGQLDTARWQNIVTKVSQDLKMQVETDKTLTPEQKAEKLKELDKQEKFWGSKAATGYSYANGHGLIGIGAAAGLAFVFNDMAPAWAENILNTISKFFGNEPTSVSLGRLVFAYASAVAGVLAYKNIPLLKDFLQKVGKTTKITQENLDAGKINAASFGYTEKNVGRRLAEINDTMTKKLDTKLVDYGVSSEQKMTDILNSMVNMYNRLVAAKELEPEKAAYYLENFKSRMQTYNALLQKNKRHLSVKLARQFEKLRAAMFENGDLNTIKANPQYIEEGSYTMPLDYNLYEESRSLLDELDRLANEIRTGGRVGVKSYDRFISYQNRVKKLLQTYSEKNPEESSKVLEAMNRLNNICVSLRTLDQQFNIIEKNAGQSKPEDIRRLRDVLDGYAEK